jgi:hypothetical protein
MLAAQHVSAQKQLILLKGEKVKLRLYPGDEFIYSLKGSSVKSKSYINNLFDTAVIAHNTVVPFYKIDKIYFHQSNFRNVVGGLLVTAGVGYFLIDQLNVVVVGGEKPHLDERVTVPAAVLVATGLPLMLWKKKYQKIGGRYKLRMVEKGSSFWKPDLRQDAMGSFGD